MDYTRTDSGKVQGWFAVDGTKERILFQASNVRKQSTGVHALVTIALNTTILDEDTFNIGRREERNRLANAALASPLLPAAIATRVKPHIQHELLLFTRGLWEFEVGNLEPVRRGGSWERKAPDWLLEPWILRKAGTILFAPPGRGKSWTAIHWNVLVDSGHEFPYPVKQAPSLLINLERSAESIDTRLGDINGCLGLPRDRPIFRLDARGRTLADIWDAADKVIIREGIELVTLDSLSRGGFGDMTGNEPANKAMDGLNAFNTGWCALGHTPRADESHVFGSQMFEAAADLEIQLLTEDKGDVIGVGFKGVKANDVRKPPLQVMAYEFDDRGIVQIRRARPGEFLRIENTGAEIDAMTQVTDFLVAEGKSDPTTIAEVLGLKRTTVSSLLKAHPNVFQPLAFENRRRMYGVRAHNDVTTRHVPSPRSSSEMTTKSSLKASSRHVEEEQEGPNPPGFEWP